MKKGFTLIEMMCVIVILGMISIIVSPLIINKVKEKQSEVDEVKNKLIYNAASLYISDNVSDIGDNSTFCVKINDLVNNGYLDNSISDDVSLNDVVKVEYTDNFKNYNIVSSDSCIATNQTYLTISKLKNKAHSKCNVSTKENCKNNSLNYIDSFDNPSASIYPYALSYAYMGSVPNNLVRLGDNCFSIIGITNENYLKLIYEGVSTDSKCSTLARDNSYSLNRSWYNTQSSDNFSLSTLKTEFDSFLNDTNLNSTSTLGDLTLTSTDKAKIQKSIFYIGNYDGVILQDLLISEKQASFLGYVGLINASDYIITSLNSNCSLSTASIENYCSDKNFLVSRDDVWTLDKTNSNNAAAIKNGILTNTDTTESLLIRPVIFLKSDVRLTGNGTSDVPYVVN